MYDPPGGKGFWARKSDLSSGDSTFYRVTSLFIASSKNANVYAEMTKDAKSTVPRSSVDGLIAAFENNIVPIEHLWFTTPTDVDNNGKVTFLLLDIQDGYQPGGGYIAGYFDPINHYSDVSVNAANSKYHSNQAEMLYLDTYPADVTRNSFFATLAHEYQHLLQFGRYYQGLQADIEPAWVDEGLAEVSSDLTGYGPQTGRANNWRTALLNTTPLITKDNAPFLLDNYATSYIYFRYLADVYGIGGIAAIFNDTAIGVSGVERGIQSVDPQLTTNCTSTAGLNYPFFGCSYRYMWAALINGSPGDATVNTKFRYNSLSDAFLGGSASFTYRLNTTNASFAQELTNTLSNGSYGPVTNSTTGALQGYAPKLYKIQAAAPVPNFQSCTNCGLSMVVGANYFVVFNHDATASSTRSATVVDQLSPQQLVQSDVTGSESFVANTPANPADELASRALHWHFRLNPEIREFLQP